ncbi:GNAT family N-acetyltransferase [Mesorhizobium waimense]|nr:GNAT family N-acetyltransferase [Mesorhizobium waimense]
MKILLDTNIIIHLEDNKEVSEQFSDLIRQCSEHSIGVFVHPASIEDIKRDNDAARRKVTLSKVRKFQQLENVLSPPEAKLAKLYGPLKKANDVCDAKMLHAVDKGIVDVFITEDDRLHRRAKLVNLSNQVLTVAEALVWLKRLYGVERVFLPTVQDVKAYNVNFEDPIFTTLAADYGRKKFAEWTSKCEKEHRDCWVVMDGADLAGLVIRKNETHAEAGTRNLGPKILKICTFKVADGHHGFKIGEQLLKQVLWHVQRNRYDLTYLTVYPKQEALIRLIEEYGFRHTLDMPNGEQIYEKVVKRGALKRAAGQTALEAAREHYPRFCDDAVVSKFVIPIKPGYHAKLFPEVTAPPAGTTGVGAKPGNTVKKVYICNTPSNQMEPGDLIFFYMTKSTGYGSQSLTSLGVVESVRITSDVHELRRWTAKRSVFTDAELGAWVTKPLKVIDFLLIGHLEPTLDRGFLNSENVINAWPQSVTKLSSTAYKNLKPMLNLGFKF